MKQRGRVEVLGEFKAMEQIVSAMQEEVKDLSVLTDDKLQKRIDKTLDGGRIPRDAPFGHTQYSFRKGIIKLVKQEK